MASNPYNCTNPLSNAQVLADYLANGQLNVATALAQVNHFVCETLKTIEEFSEEQAKLYSKGKAKMDKMDKVIYELSEKCQAMQQALLFKEEKYDEKCREVERYKMICEMAAENAIKPPKNIVHHDVNNNHASTTSDDEPQDRKDRIVKMENQQAGTSTPSKRHVVKHCKFSQSHAHLGQHAAPLQMDSPTPTRTHHQEGFDDERKLMTQYYVGGPSKRKVSKSCNNANPYDFGTRVKERLEMIGGVNIRSSQLVTGPVPLSRLVTGPMESSYNEESNKRVKIDVTGQRNEFLSSSGNNAQRMKQRIVEKDLHKQVAGGTWTRLASRRKKDWPF